jgi:hypothetical protein
LPLLALTHPHIKTELPPFLWWRRGLVQFITASLGAAPPLYLRVLHRPLWASFSLSINGAFSLCTANIPLNPAIPSGHREMFAIELPFHIFDATDVSAQVGVQLCCTLEDFDLRLSQSLFLALKITLKALSG